MKGKRSLLTVLVVLGLLVFAFGLVRAADVPNRDDAEALVKEAVRFAKENGKVNLLEEVKNPRGKFHFQQGTKKGLYIFVFDEKGVVLAHGARSELNGRNRWNDTDLVGAAFVREWTEMLARRGGNGSSGWTYYREMNPDRNNAIMTKSTFVEQVKGMIIGCGVYE